MAIGITFKRNYKNNINKFNKIMKNLQFDIATLILRLSLGIIFLSHGLLKLLVFTPAGTAAFFESMGFPAFLADLTIFAEIVGGALIILGIQTRFVTLSLLPVLFGATYVHFGNGWVFSAANGGWEFPVLLIAISAVQIILGGGKFSLSIPLLPKDILLSLFCKKDDQSLRDSC